MTRTRRKRKSMAKQAACYTSLRWRDACNNLAFRLQTKAQRERYDQFRTCRTLEDYYGFAKEVIGLTQRRSEILGLLEYVSALRPRYACEIGTHRGGTNLLISQALPGVRIMVGIDLYVQQKYKLLYFCHPDRTLHYINGSSHATRHMNRVARALGDNQLDFLFIDGDHTYEGVRRDFLNYRTLVREGGIIAFHDIVPDHRTRYGKDAPSWSGNVPIFWQKLKTVFRHREFIDDPRQDGMGIGALQYSADVSLPGDL